MSNEKIVKLINNELGYAKKLDRSALYAAGYIDGLEMALKIIRDCDSEALEEMAKYYNKGDK